MWFDPYKAIIGIDRSPPATPATTATNRADRPSRVAEVADVATMPRLIPEIEQPAHRAPEVRPRREIYPYGTACDMGDAPRTWTGRVVSLDEWRRLTEWEKHGPNGRLWNGITRQWEQPERGAS